MRPLARSLLLCLLMLGSAAAALALRPTQRLAELGPAVVLEHMIPARLGEWQMDETPVIQMVDPQQQQTIERLYTQTLNRTYINPAGYRIMLSLAYGADQRDEFQVHKPEVCYPAQGFILHERFHARLPTALGVLPVTRIRASLGMRDEPVTYWTTLGNHVVKPGGINKKRLELHYGLAGQIPDGMLVRVSSIDGETTRAYEQQAIFINQLLAVLPPEVRERVAGHLENH